MEQIKLFVCCHKEETVPKHPLLVPIQVGASLAEKRFEGFFHDDEGENISEKNRSYCELTAQYWAWKNIDAEFYGLFHYRRYLYPQKAYRPYKICSVASKECLSRLGYDSFVEVIRSHDLIMPMAENMYVTVREHYAKAPYHHGKDLELVEKIVWERYPEMVEAMETYLSGTQCYFGNICIMKSSVFEDYCRWLFAILEEFDLRANTNAYGVQEKRVDGYLAERLLGVYYTYHRNKLKTLELPRVHFIASRKEKTKLLLMNFLLPPGSLLRALMKRVIK